MDCVSKSSVDFCEDPNCATATVDLDERDDLEKPHIPTHQVFKVYAVLHGRYYAMTETKAKNALKKSRALLSDEGVDADSDSESDSESESGEAEPAPAAGETASVPESDKAKIAPEPGETESVAEPSGTAEAKPVQNVVSNDVGKPPGNPVTKSPPICAHCKEKVSLTPPCWACVECGTLSICISDMCYLH